MYLGNRLLRWLVIFFYFIINYAGKQNQFVLYYIMRTCFFTHHMHLFAIVNWVACSSLMGYLVHRYIVSISVRQRSLPADAAYITRLFTGTFNQNLNYTIYYKTNKTGSFKVLWDNLFTNKVYEIDCTKGLMAGEYITDIKYEFGTVDVGFCEVERPFIYCKTYQNLPNGYQFTNRVEVGGMYEMQKVKAEDSFTTKIYAPVVSRGKLPKTGY